MYSKTIEQVLYTDVYKAADSAESRNINLIVAAATPALAAGSGYLNYKLAKNKPKSFLGKGTLRGLELTNEKRRKAGKKPLSLKQYVTRTSLAVGTGVTLGNLAMAAYHHQRVKHFLK